MDISSLKTYCERRLGSPIIPIELDKEFIVEYVNMAEEDINETGVRLSDELKHNFIKEYVLSHAKMMVGRLKGRYIKGSNNELLKGVDIDPEELIKEGQKQLFDMFIELENIRKGW